MRTLFCLSRSPSLTWYLWTRSWRTSHIRRILKSKWLIFFYKCQMSLVIFTMIIVRIIFFQFCPSMCILVWSLLAKNDWCLLSAKVFCSFIWKIIKWLQNRFNIVLTVTFVWLCVQDGADTRGSDQCERYQSEQLPRRSHGQDHLCQRWEGEAPENLPITLIVIYFHNNMPVTTHYVF